MVFDLGMLSSTVRKLFGTAVDLKFIPDETNREAPIMFFMDILSCKMIGCCPAVYIGGGVLPKDGRRGIAVQVSGTNSTELIKVEPARGAGIRREQGLLQDELD